jgi:hypothetical protein
MASDYNARHEAVVKREEAKHERKKAKAEAAEQNMTRTLAGLLKQETVKKALAQDAMAATKDESRLKDIHKRAGAGTYDNDREVITGDEPRPWED